MSRTSESGFTLLELTVCVAILALASAATLGGLAAVARGAAPQATRDAALMVAENALARARAATAYLPANGTAAANVQSLAWALQTGTTTYDAGAKLLAPSLCGASAPLVLTLPVSVTYDGAQTVQVTVTYPRDPCAAAGARASVTLSTTLPPPVFAPGTRLTRTIAPPARM
jgi:prepilin-type N-terminal cleavage/methylation domain-containing protein